MRKTSSFYSCYNHNNLRLSLLIAAGLFLHAVKSEEGLQRTRRHKDDDQ